MKSIWEAIKAWATKPVIKHRIEKNRDGTYYIQRVGNKFLPGSPVSSKRHLTPGGAAAEAQALGLKVGSQ